MGMNVASLSARREPEVLMDVNTTPLIDVMLVLLVMLIITIPTQLHSIHIDITPFDGPPPVERPIVHTVSIDFDGTVAWDGQPLPTPAALDARLQEVGALSPHDQPAVHIKANRLSDYQAFAAVMSSARRHEVAKLAIVGQEQFAR
jgi:biopolymer transport protein ExbD